MDLASLRFGGAGDGPRVLITAGVHGDEYEPMAALRRLGRWLDGRALKGRVTLVPVVNEPAFRLCRRTADDGLDLARACPGRPDGTVTERVAAALSALIRDADAYVDLHTGGAAFRILPLAGYMLHPDPDVLDAQRALARAFGLPVVWGTDPGLEGRSLSVARDANVPAIYAEYLGGGGCDRNGVDALVQGCRNVLAALGVTGEAVALPRVRPLAVEDRRPGSGHMQAQHPAPRGGFFEPAVVLGQWVRGGERVGVVTDPLGAEPVAIDADRPGVVLVLRALPRVEAGDGLAVVLEANGTPPAPLGPGDRVT